MADRVDPLAMDREAMRRAGYAAVDAIVGHLADLATAPVNGGGSRAEMEALFREPVPHAGVSIESLIDRFAREVIPNSLKVNHPRFFAYIPGSPVFPAVLGDLLAAGANTYAGTWLASPAATTIELVVIDWFRELLGLTPGTEGVLVSGGSVANLTALAVAREAKLGAEARQNGVLYTSDQRHSAIDRAVRILGFGSDRLRVIPSDDAFRIRTDLLAAAIDEDRSRDLTPFCLIAHGGTTNTGAVDPIQDLALLADRFGLWLHVDAAYGGFAAMTERGASLFAGLDRADSIALDPHKWLFQPFEAGCVLVREPGLLAGSFGHRAAYMREVPPAEEEVTFADRGIQLSRSFRALKIWMTLKHFGVGPIAAAIERACDLAHEAAGMLERGGFEVLARPELSVVAFRIPGADDDRQVALVDAVNRSGKAFLSSTTLRGRVALRLCVLSPATAYEDVAATVELLGSLAF